MRLNLWTEIRTAWHVARHRNVSRAAQELGMHHSSVIRHVDALEQALGVKLFQRHSQGYTPTEAGEELLRTAGSVDEQLADMMTRIETSRTQISGRLVLTVVPGLDLAMMPIIERYQREYPQVQVVYSSDMRNYELNRGEAHVALRAGPRPTDPDNVVVPLFQATPALYAAPNYAERFGLPQVPEDLCNHRFVVGDEQFARAPFNQWLLSRLPDQAIVLRAPQVSVVFTAIFYGVGIGFLSPLNAPPMMIPVLPEMRLPEWRSDIWLVTHVDLHRSPKVQSLTRFIQQEVKQWNL